MMVMVPLPSVCILVTASTGLPENGEEVEGEGVLDGPEGEVTVDAMLILWFISLSVASP